MDQEPDWTIRPPTASDVEAIVALLNRCTQASTGRDECTPRRINNDWNVPGIDPQRDMRVAEAADGTLLGYCQIWAIGKPMVRIHCGIDVDPAARASGVTEALIAWGEARARQAIALAPDAAQVSMGLNFNSVDSYLSSALGIAGFQHVRNSYLMQIELDQAIPEPQWPEGISVGAVNPEAELERIVVVIRDAFKDHWGHVDQPLEHDLTMWRHWLSEPGYDPEQWWAALDGAAIAGCAICWSMTDEDPDMGWISTLGILRPWRRQGLALALLHHAFREFQRRGKARAGLGVDASSLTNAVALYERAGMQVARWFEIHEKILRAGIDLSTQQLAQA